MTLDPGVTEILPIRREDAGEVLTVQRAAFVQEALIYREANLPALTQSLAELDAELEDNLGCVVRLGGRLVGAARGVLSGELLLIGRIAIVPDLQGEGIGGQLLDAVEERGRRAGAIAAELFTGSYSEANIRLYERHGYRETQRVPGDGDIEQVFLRKDLADG